MNTSVFNNFEKLKEELTTKMSTNHQINANDRILSQRLIAVEEQLQVHNKNTEKNNRYSKNSNKNNSNGSQTKRKPIDNYPKSGITRSGNTCHLNAAMQILLSVPEVRELTKLDKFNKKPLSMS